MYLYVWILSIHTDLNMLFGFWSQSIKHCPSHLGSICVKILSLVPIDSNNLFFFIQNLHFKGLEHFGHLFLPYFHRSKPKESYSFLRAAHYVLGAPESSYFQSSVFQYIILYMCPTATQFFMCSANLPWPTSAHLLKQWEGMMKIKVS